MSVSFLLSLAALSGASAPGPLAAEPLPLVQEEGSVDASIAACGTDTAKLWALAQELKTASKYADARKVMEKIVEIDPEHADARKGLGHQKYADKWFKSSVELMMFRRTEEKEMRDKGLVRLNDDWVPVADAPFLRMGWSKDASGRWTDPRKLARLEQEKKYAAENWQQQDLTWIPPDEFAKWDEGLWKCGDDWLDAEAAEAFHSQIGRWWTIPGQHFIVASTCSRNGSDWAVTYADATWPDLVRLYGKEPDEKPNVVVLNSLEQYNDFAGGSQEKGIPPSEVTGFSSVHHSFFAEALFDTSQQPPVYHGCGVAFWDYKPELTGWGRFSIAHAAGLSYAEAIDPSWDTISQVLSNPGAGAMQGPAFWAEKKIPLWVRFGGACYVEVFAKDALAQEGADPLANRTWAVGHLREMGGLRPLKEVFAFQRDLNDLPGSTRLIFEAGAIVSYVLDGGNKDVTAAHQSWKKAVASGKGLAQETEALQNALVASEQKLREFHGLTVASGQ